MVSLRAEHLSAEHLMESPLVVTQRETLHFHYQQKTKYLRAPKHASREAERTIMQIIWAFICADPALN